MSHPDPNADLVEQVLTAAREIAGAGAPVTDLAIADAAGLELPTVRAVLSEEDRKAVTLLSTDEDRPWEVRL